MNITELLTALRNEILAMEAIIQEQQRELTECKRDNALCRRLASIQASYTRLPIMRVRRPDGELAFQYTDLGGWADMIHGAPVSLAHVIWCIERLGYRTSYE